MMRYKFLCCAGTAAGAFSSTLTGIWPILSIKTFLMVTGPKTDLWLVKTVGIILATIGATLVIAQLNAQVNSSVIFLAIGSALSLTVVEVIYVAKRVISPIYLGARVLR